VYLVLLLHDEFVQCSLMQLVHDQMTEIHREGNPLGYKVLLPQLFALFSTNELVHRRATAIELHKIYLETYRIESTPIAL
jgi:hypothetical protein